MKLTPLAPQSSKTTGVAAMNGHLYQNTGVGVFDVTATADPPGQQPVARGGQAIAADPMRNRLLILNDDNAWVVHAYTPPKAEPTTSSKPLPFTAHAIAVADGEIWVTGMTGGTEPHPVLAQLDPTTLEITRHSQLERSLGSLPVIAARGDNLWIRSDGTNDELWCVNPHTGNIAQHWDALPGNIAAQTGQAYVASEDSIGQLKLNESCTG